MLNCRENRARRKPLIAVAAAAIIFFSGSLWDNPLIKSRQPSPPSIENALFAPASRIVKISTLKAESNEKKHAYGIACIVDNGQSKQFVVYVFGALPTKNEQAYQVWLLRDGNRSSAGTFRVDEKGIGLLSMAIESGELNYDRIGITLEPDDKGNHPRGPKTFGTEAIDDQLYPLPLRVISARASHCLAVTSDKLLNWPAPCSHSPPSIVTTSPLM